jgi:dienelactone hydrolase
MSSAAIDERDFRIDDETDPLRTLRGRVSTPAGAEEQGLSLPWVLVLHGFKGFFDWGFYPELTRRLCAHGLAVVRFNFSGSGIGETLGEFSEEEAFFENRPSREVEDADRVRTWIDSGAVPWLDRERRALLGHSMGGGVALLHAAQRYDYRAVVSWAPVATFRRFPAEVEGLWRRQGYVEIPNMRTKQVHRLGLGWLEDIDANPRTLDIVGACRRLATPTLIVHGTEDEAVPLAEGRSLFEAFAPDVARMEVVEGANHTFWAAHPLQEVPPTLERVLSWSTGFLTTRLL